MFEAPQSTKIIPLSELNAVRSTERFDSVYNIGNCVRALPIALDKSF
jgi:hypothetical protein